MTQPDFDHADRLRRALHAEADSIEPAGDGLERIRARLTAPRPASVAWITAVLAGAAGRARGGLESVWAWLQAVWAWLRAALGTVREQFRMPTPGLAAERLRLVRHPVVVAGAGLLAAVVVTFALAPLPGQAVSQAVALIWSFESGGSASAASGPAVIGHGTEPGGAAGATGAAHGQPGHKSPAAASCPARASAAVAACPSPGACPSPTASAHPSRIPSPTATPTPTATPSPSATPASSATPTPSSSTGARACPTPSASASPHPSASSPPSPTSTPTSTPPPSPSSSSTTPSPPSSSPAPSPSADPAGSPAPSPSADPTPTPSPSGPGVVGSAGEG